MRMRIHQAAEEIRARQILGVIEPHLPNHTGLVDPPTIVPVPERQLDATDCPPRHRRKRKRRCGMSSLQHRQTMLTRSSQPVEHTWTQYP